MRSKRILVINKLLNCKMIIGRSMFRKAISGTILTLLFAVMMTLACSSSIPLVKGLWVWKLPIPYVPSASKVTIDGEIVDEAWNYAEHFHNYSTHKQTIEFDVYLMHDGVSMYIGAVIHDNDFWGSGWQPDAFEVEINDRNDGRYGGSSGNDLKSIWVTATGCGNYFDLYIPYDTRFDTTVDGEGDFTFSGLRQNGELGDYYFELKIPIEGSHPEDAKLSEGVPFGMMISFIDYDPVDNVGYGYWLLQGSYILETRPPVITATIDIDPDTLNLKSNGKWITAYIELPEGYNVADINRTTILLNDTIPVDSFWTDKPLESVIGDYDNDTIPDLMVKFERARVISYILANINKTKLFEEKFMRVTLTITGKLNDGIPFQGSDIITIVMPMPRAIYKIFLFPI